MPEIPYISVIIPTHNRVKSLRATLRSLLEQTYPRGEYEIIVVDDGSQDGTAILLEELAGQGELFFHRQRQAGPAAARNAGARLARGQVLVFTDDDCLPQPGWLAAFAESYASEGKPAAVGGRIDNLDDGHWLHRFFKLQDTQHLSYRESPRLFLDTANASYRRDVFWEVGGFDESFPLPGAEDFDLGYRFVLAGHNLEINTQAVIVHNASTSVRDYFRRSYRIGFGTGILMLQHPQLFSQSGGGRLRRAFRYTLEAMYNASFRSPELLRPIASGGTATLRRGIHDSIGFWIVGLPHLKSQSARYGALQLSWHRRLLYLALELGALLCHQLGQLTGTWYRASRLARTPPEARTHDPSERLKPDNGLHSLLAQILTTSFPYALPGVQGWLTTSEKKALYILGRELDGPILEIGPWVGLSTACLAHGIRDSGMQKAFITAELNPTLQDFQQVDGQVVFILPGDEQGRGTTDLETFRKLVEPVLSQPGRAVGQLRRNLENLGISPLVTVVEGDFTCAPNLGYNLVFCDAAHSPYEIEQVLPPLLPFLAPGAVLAFHDITPETETVLRRHLQFIDCFQVGSLFVGQVPRRPVSSLNAVGETRSELSPRDQPAQAEMQEASNHRLTALSTRTEDRKQDSEPAVSVLLPTYNRAHLLSRAILSVLNQSYQDIELVVVDDGSTDETARIVAGLQNEKIVYIRHSERLGAAAARNTALRASRGRWIAFQDSDDEWLPGGLSILAAALENSPSQVGVVYSGFRWANERGSGRFPPRSRVSLSRLPLPGLRLAGDLCQALYRGNFISLQTALVRRECFQTAGGFDENLPRLQDWDLWLRIAQRYHFNYVDETLAVLYYTPGSISSDAQALQGALEIILQKHRPNRRGNPELYAHCQFLSGDLGCHGEDFSKGRGSLWRAVLARPARLNYLAAALASLAGKNFYTWLVDRLGISYLRGSS